MPPTRSGRLSEAAPFSKLRLALLRTSAALIAAIPLTVAVALIVPNLTGYFATWLLPGLALTVATLILLTWLSAWVACGVTSLGWIAAASLATGKGTIGAVATTAGSGLRGRSRCSHRALRPRQHCPARAGGHAMTATLDNVSKSYGRTVALHPTTLVLERGVVGLLGPTAPARPLCCGSSRPSLAPDAGITVAGHDVTGSHAERTEARRRIGYLPQEVVFPRGMTAFGFLDYIAVLKEWRDTSRRHAEVRRVLEMVDLAERGRTKVKALSGGQRRRLSIAQSLLGAPELLILDEPTTGLDPEQRASLRGLLSGLPGTVLISTHQTEDVSALCDRVIVGSDAGRSISTATCRVSWRPPPGKCGPGPAGYRRRPVQSWRTTGTGRSGPSAAADRRPRPAEPAVEDAYLLLKSETNAGVTR